MNSPLEALSQAAGEAMTNAAKHSGAAKISVYLEVTDDTAEIFVGDGGKGFDTQAASEHDRGIVNSIVGRMQRHSGEATIVSEPGEGTEVQLRMPRN